MAEMILSAAVTVWIVLSSGLTSLSKGYNLTLCLCLFGCSHLSHSPRPCVTPLLPLCSLLPAVPWGKSCWFVFFFNRWEKWMVFLACRIFPGFACFSCVLDVEFPGRAGTWHRWAGLNPWALECSDTVTLLGVLPTFPSNGGMIHMCSIQLSCNRPQCL